MRLHCTLSSILALVPLVASGCQAPAKVMIERQVPASAPGEPESHYSVAVSRAIQDENSAELCRNLADHVCAELVRYGLGSSKLHPANRSIALRIVDYQDVPEAERAFNPFSGSDKLVVEVEVRSASPESVIGLARVALLDRQGLQTTSEDYLVNEVAEKIVDFIRGKAVNAPPPAPEQP